jgi:hypothetical protein
MSKLLETKFVEQISSFAPRSGPIQTYSLWDLLGAASKERDPEYFLRKFGLRLIPQNEIVKYGVGVSAHSEMPKDYVEHYMRAELADGIVRSLKELPIEWGKENKYLLSRPVSCVVYVWMEPQKK